ncbi:hypothetical protein ACWCY6_07135 [Streptomyces sp. 900105755]
MARAEKNAKDITSLRYRISGTVPGKGRLEAAASMNTQPLAMSMKMTAAAAQGGNGQGRRGQLEIRFVGKVMYVGGSAVRPETLKGKSWLSAAPAMWGRGGGDNQSYVVLPSQLQANPTEQSTLLTGSKDVSDPLTMDLWIEGDGRTKQFRMRAEHSDMLAGTGDGRRDLSITFFDIDKPMAIKAPPTKDTTPLADDAQDR